MTGINAIVVYLLYQNKGIKEITDILGITEKQLYVRINQIIKRGYNIKPSYNYNSDIFYNIVDDLFEKEKNFIRINMENNNNIFKCLVISDTHIGNIDSNIDLLKIIYEYAAKEEINIILNCGDLIEGTHTTDRKNINNIYDQINMLVKKHPYDKNIRVFSILGNHDFHSLYYDNIDLLNEIIKYRYDIIPVGYGKGIVNIKNDRLLLQHELSIVSNPILKEESRLSLVGHGHEMKTKIYDKLYLCVPSLSSVTPDKTKKTIPGFIDLTINFENDLFEYIECKHMVVTPKIYEIGQTRARMSSLNFDDYKRNNR